MCLAYDTGGHGFQCALKEPTSADGCGCISCLGNNLCLFYSGPDRKQFLELCQHFETKENFFGDTMVFMEVFGKIKLSSNKTSIEDLKFWVKEFFLPKLQYFVFPEDDVSVYTSTQKEAKKDGYTEEKHRNLYEKALREKGYTPVEVVIYSRFDFTGVLTY